MFRGGALLGGWTPLFRAGGAHPCTRVSYLILRVSEEICCVRVDSYFRGCFGGDFGDDAATLARAAQWRRENPDLAVRQAEFFHSLWDDPGGAVAKEELLALGLSPDYRHECGICDRDYMLRRGCPCCRD